MYMNFLSILNILMAIVAVPPSIALIRMLLRERPALTKQKGPLNTLLIFIMAIIALGSIFNAFVSVSVMFFPRIAPLLAHVRSLTMTSSFAVAAWGLFLYKEKIK